MPFAQTSAPYAARGTEESMERMLRELLATKGGGAIAALSDRIWRPPTDVYETDEVILICVEIAGMNPQGFRVNFNNGRLIVQGRREDTCRHQKRLFRQMEIHYGPFAVIVVLSEPVDETGIHATYRNGLLEITVPKLKPRITKIPIEGEEDE